MAVKKSYVKKRATKRRAPRRRIPRSVSTNQPEHASMSCTRSLTVSTVNTMYSVLNTQLVNFTRATTVAQGYQFYRITNIKLRVKSPFDTYQNTGTAYQKPYFYYMLDKSGSIPTNVNLEGLKQMGAKPRVMDEKAITVSWKPSVLTLVATNLPVVGSAPLANAYKLSPWLATCQDPQTPAWSPSQVDHLGIYWGAFAQATGAPDPITYEVEMEVQFEFKGPLVYRNPSTTSATPAAFAIENDSVDGVVGGPDGV